MIKLLIVSEIKKCLISIGNIWFNNVEIIFNVTENIFNVTENIAKLNSTFFSSLNEENMWCIIYVPNVYTRMCIPS